jgi:hypothetical protein
MLKDIATYPVNPVDYVPNDKDKYELSLITTNKDGENVVKVVECDIFTLQNIIKTTNAIVISVKRIVQNEKLQNRNSKPVFRFV